jgi:NADPH-dependent 2,4-dienoyl-CoA reductase/sulfur reductase-like enzyme
VARERVVVVGGDAGGMTAAAQARRRRSIDELEIVCFERGEHTSYAACGIPYFVGDLVRDADALVARAPEEHRRRGIDVRTGHEVVGIDLAARVAHVRGGAGSDTTEGFDQLVIATGATPFRPPLPGIDAAGVFGVQTLAEGIALRRVVDDARPEHAVVVGCGYIGLELAEALVMRGVEVSLVEAGAQPLPTLDPDMGALVADAVRSIGIECLLEEPVEGFELDDGRVRAVRTANHVLPADLVVLGLGVRPASQLAADAGLAIGATHGVVVDDHQRTSAEGVYAAGDCVETYHRVSQRPVAIALGTHANKQGRVAGINLTGGDAVFPGVIGTAVSKICKYEVARTGLTEREAREVGVDAFAVTIDATTRAGYYPGAKPIKVKLVVQRDGGRVLGGQIVGEEGAAKRIDVVAMAVWTEMTVTELLSVDLGYAPPFSPLWDPVLVAARQAVGALGGD